MNYFPNIYAIYVYWFSRIEYGTVLQYLQLQMVHGTRTKHSRPRFDDDDVEKSPGADSRKIYVFINVNLLFRKFQTTPTYSHLEDLFCNPLKPRIIFRF